MKMFSLPIKWKLTLWYTLILALILVAFSSSVYIYFRNSLQKSIDTKIKSIADVLSSSMVETHGTNVFSNFERYLENVLGKKPKGKFIQIMDSSGRIGAKMSDIEAETIPTSFSALEKALKGEVVYETIESASKQRIRTVIVPIMEKERDKVTTIVQVGTSLEDFDETIRRLLLIFLISIPTSIAITTVSGYFLARKALKPVDKIRRTAIKISSSNLDERIDVGEKRDELGRLATTFNDMIERLKESFQRINQFSIDVSHELKTPLTILKGETEVALRKDRNIEEYKKILKSNLEEIDRMTKIIDDLLLLSKAESNNIVINQEDIQIKDLLVDICMSMEMFAKQKGVELVLGNMEEANLRGDELKIRRMFSNIIENGIKYTPKGGKVEVYSSLNNGYINIYIKDNGIGIPESDIKFIFDRFYRGDKSRRRETGSGLGLSISKWIAQAHKGTIEVKSVLSQGSTFIVKLPLRDE